ncbi:hypothetical protein [Seonamhaeicola marinus]|uniref:TonB-dependent receptor plug domain-containing protein n=1 Tax=Seonamhaeicola marinus TaxID=1912246 RepID=A0A5D0HRR8_9FLAO|nr:hypothetical protein [Seonamhaeicola marinus]TYA74063.1 hypothetical protein FUA24_12000 [Seonamhaeicola marinus]
MLKKQFSNLNLGILLFLSVIGINAQQNSKLLITSKEAYAEKIYLQLSKNVFTTEEIIWIKAVVTDAVNHAPTKLSEVLYVELIDFDERVIDNKVLKLDSGISSTFFQLDETIAPGRYLIRAYTEWNKNFGDTFISKQYVNIYKSDIPDKNESAIRNVILTETQDNQLKLSAQLFPKVINPKYRGKLKVLLDLGENTDSVELRKDKAGFYQLDYVLPQDIVKAKLELKLDSIKVKNFDFDFVNTYSKWIVVNKDYTDLQFFPEGGKLIDGLPTKLAFKALDYDGKGKFVQGTIIDQLGNEIKRFRSNKLGMGAILLLPNKNKTYFAQIMDNKGVTYKYPIPEIHEKGHVLSVRQLEAYVAIRILSNYKPSDSLILKTSSRGVVYHKETLILKNGKLDVALNKQALPEGIIKISLFNQLEEPILERLFFNVNDSKRLKLDVQTNLSTYSQRDKVNIEIAAVEKNSDTIAAANYSVLVLNKKVLGDTFNGRNNIYSYFLLDSELKGVIESPMRYFNKENTKRNRDLDVLMLTQGWRNYIFEPKDSDISFSYRPEKGIHVSGNVRSSLNPKKKPKKPLELTLMTFGKPEGNVFTQSIDSTGSFTFNVGEVYSDDLKILLQTRNHKGKNKDFVINLDKKALPEINFEEKEKVQLADSVNAFVEKSAERKQIEDAFNVSSNTIALDEVNITGYKMTPERERMMDLHGPPDVVIEDKELHKKVKNWSYGLFSVLLFNYPEDINVRRVGRNGGFLIAEVFGADFTCILIDGIPVRIRDYPLIGDLPTEEIKSVEIIESPKSPKKYAFDIFGRTEALDRALVVSFINIYTYSKKGLFGVSRTPGMTKATISGLSPKLEFYTPKHENLTAEDWRVPDLRSVIHWNPEVKANSKGKAEVEFFNSDDIGDMLVIVEGITKDGKIGYFETNYSVEEKLEK